MRKREAKARREAGSEGKETPDTNLGAGGPDPKESAAKGKGEVEPEADNGAGETEPRPEGPLTVKAGSSERTVTYHGEEPMEEDGKVHGRGVLTQKAFLKRRRAEKKRKAGPKEESGPGKKPRVEDPAETSSDGRPSDQKPAPGARRGKAKRSAPPGSQASTSASVASAPSLPAPNSVGSVSVLSSVLREGLKTGLASLQKSLGDFTDDTAERETRRANRTERYITTLERDLTDTRSAQGDKLDRVLSTLTAVNTQLGTLCSKVEDIDNRLARLERGRSGNERGGGDAPSHDRDNRQGRDARSDHRTRSERNGDRNGDRNRDREQRRHDQGSRGHGSYPGSYPSNRR